MQINEIELSLASEINANAIARISRDHIEYGFQWSWRPEKVRRSLHNAEHVVLGAYRGKHLIGFAIAAFARHDAHLLLLAVLPRYRRYGVATNMLQWLQQSMRTAGLGSMWVQLRTRNLPGRAFYARIGFRDYDTLAGYYERKEDAFRMVFELGSKRSAASPGYPADAVYNWQFQGSKSPPMNSPIDRPITDARHRPC